MQNKLLLVASILCSSASACPVDLQGEWRSDKELSMAFLERNTRMEQKQIDFLASLFGHMTIQFTPSELVTRMPDISVSVAGEQRPFKGVNSSRPYRVIFCDQYQVVVEARQLFAESLGVTTYHVASKDLLWVYSGATDPSVPDLHVREYFRRVP